MKGIEIYVQISPPVRTFTIEPFTTTSNGKCKRSTAGMG